MPVNVRHDATALRRMILEMGSLVQQRVEQAVQALREGREDIARHVREGDGDIDEMDVNIESHCLQFLALSQPVAGDLRLVLTVMRINNELERIGDEARSLAKRVLDLGRLGAHDHPAAIDEMSTQACRMLNDALSALTHEDSALARRVRAADERVDDLQKEVFAWVQREIPRHVEATEAAIDLLSVARRLERIADLSTNIAEEVIFLVEGTVVRHVDA